MIKEKLLLFYIIKGKRHVDNGLYIATSDGILFNERDTLVMFYADTVMFIETSMLNVLNVFIFMTCK